MLQNLPFVLSAAIIVYLLTMWIYSKTYSGGQRIMFFVIGCIVLSIFYGILAAGYFGFTYTKDSWEFALTFPSVLVLLIVSVLVKSKVELCLMRSRIRSGKIGKNLLESRKIRRKIAPYRKYAEENAQRSHRTKATVELKEAVAGCSLRYLLGLIERGANIYGPYEHKKNPLMMFEWWPDAWQKAAILLHLGVDVNARDTDGMTPLSHAADLGNAELIHCLIAGGADTHARDNKGWNALMCFLQGHAVKSSKSTHKTLETLVMVCDINAQDSEGLTPLMHAVSYNLYTPVTVLIKKGADPRIKNNRGHTTVRWARIEDTDENIVKLLKKAAKKASTKK